MAKTRLELHEELKMLCNNCYFSPPDGFDMSYPCIVYKLESDKNGFADNYRYTRYKRYTVTIITQDPDSEMPDKLIERFHHCTFDRHFTNDNLNHFVHTLYY